MDWRGDGFSVFFIGIENQPEGWEEGVAAGRGKIRRDFLLAKMEFRKSATRTIFVLLRLIPGNKPFVYFVVGIKPLTVIQ